MKAAVREARKEDSTDIQLFVATLLQERLDGIFARSEAPSLENIETLVQRLGSEKNSCYFLAYDNSRLVGILDLHGAQHPQKQHCAGFGMSVSAAFRGKGVGKALVQSMLDFASGTNILRRIELEVFETNVRAIRLYEAMGFNLEGKRKEAVLVNGEYIDLLCMAFYLAAPMPSEVPHNN